MSKKEIEVDKAKVAQISNLKVPSFVKQVRSFLSHAGFYRRFINDFSKVAQLLIDILTKDAPRVIDKSYMKAFEKFRSLLVSTAVDQSPDVSLAFEIMCDAPDLQLGLL